MNKLFTTFATLVLAGTVNASNESFIYHGFEKSNPDLYAGYSAMEKRTAVQPGVGDSSDSAGWSALRTQDSYDIFVMNNPDAYSGTSRSDEKTATPPGIGDRSNRPESNAAFDSDSYDNWVRGNPDQESGF